MAGKDLQGRMTRLQERMDQLEGSGKGKNKGTDGAMLSIIEKLMDRVDKMEKGSKGKGNNGIGDLATTMALLKSLTPPPPPAPVDNTVGMLAVFQAQAAETQKMMMSFMAMQMEQKKGGLADLGITELVTLAEKLSGEMPVWAKALVEVGQVAGEIYLEAKGNGASAGGASETTASGDEQDGDS